MKFYVNPFAQSFIENLLFVYKNYVFIWPIVGDFFCDIKILHIKSTIFRNPWADKVFITIVPPQHIEFLCTIVIAKISNKRGETTSRFADIFTKNIIF